MTVANDKRIVNSEPLVALRLAGSAFSRFCLCLMIAIAGCGHVEEPAKPTIVTDQIVTKQTPRLGAKELLTTVLRRYRSAAAYGDQAIVRLVYEPGSESATAEERTAPISTWFVRDHLWIQAYSVNLHVRSGKLTAWSIEAPPERYPHQVLETQFPSGRPTLDALLNDTMLANWLQSGLAGAPPQLEWLFSPDPMAKLFQSEHQFADDGESQVDGQDCRVARVDSDALTYRFHIDPRAGLIRRIDLPPPVAASDGQAPPVQVTVLFTGATFQPADKPRGLLQPPADSRFVNRLLPYPAAIDPRLGRRPPGLDQLRDSRNQQAKLLSQQTRATVLIPVQTQWDLQTATLLSQWRASAPTSFQTQVAVTAVIGPETRFDAVSQPQLNVLRDRRGDFLRTVTAGPGSLAILDRQGRVVWTQVGLSAQQLPALGVVIADLLSGVDLPRRIQQEHERMEAEFMNALAAARAD
ncbi:MAG: hypothetical protein AAGA03_04775 [Planctomycetota bacterium]